MELIRHCDDLWIDAMVVRWFRSCPWFPPKDGKYFSNLATSRDIVLSGVFLLPTFIRNRSDRGSTKQAQDRAPRPRTSTRSCREAYMEMKLRVFVTIIVVFIVVSLFLFQITLT